MISCSILCPSCSHLNAYCQHLKQPAGLYSSTCFLQQSQKLNLYSCLEDFPQSGKKICEQAAQQPLPQDCPWPHTTTWALLRNHFSSQTPAVGSPGMGLPGLLGIGPLGLLATQKHPQRDARASRLPCLSHSLILALMDIKNRTEQNRG